MDQNEIRTVAQAIIKKIDELTHLAKVKETALNDEWRSIKRRCSHSNTPKYLMTNSMNTFIWVLALAFYALIVVVIVVQMMMAQAKQMDIILQTSCRRNWSYR